MTNKCTTCGGPAIVRGKTTKYYEPLASIKNKQLKLMREALEYYATCDVVGVELDNGPTARVALKACDELNKLKGE